MESSELALRAGHAVGSGFTGQEQAWERLSEQKGLLIRLSDLATSAAVAKEQHSEDLEP